MSMMSKMQEIQNEIKKITVEIKSSDGIITLVMNGKQELVSLKFNLQMNKLNPDQVEKIMLEVFNKAIHESRNAVKNKISQTAGINLEGLMDIFVCLYLITKTLAVLVYMYSLP